MSFKHIGDFISIADAIQQITAYKNQFGSMLGYGYGFLFEKTDFSDMVYAPIQLPDLLIALGVQAVEADFFRIYLGLNSANHISLLVVPVVAIEDSDPDFPQSPGDMFQDCTNKENCKGLIRWKRPNTVGELQTFRLVDAYFNPDKPNKEVFNISVPCPPFGCDRDSVLFKAYQASN